MNETQRPSYEEIFKKLIFVLRPESSFYFISIIYGLGVSILTLAIPISVQSLVTTVTFGTLIQPLVVLSFILLSLLLFSGALNALQTLIIEYFERHLYARVSSDISIGILNVHFRNFMNQKDGLLVNRYFDVISIQKAVTKLLVDGTSIVLQTLAGLVLLAFYHPYFLIFDLILVISIWFVWSLFAQKAFATSVYESKAKYKMANWLEELARENLFFKTQSRKEMGIKKSDKLIHNYLAKRKIHFKQVFSQTLLLLAIYAVMSALILGLGGYLVMNGELTLGQLVAAELVVTVILASFSKAGRYLESLYDLYASIDKVMVFYELSSDEKIGQEPCEVECHDLIFKQAASKFGQSRFEFNYHFKQGYFYYISSKFFSAKQVFLEYIQCLRYCEEGEISYGGVNLRDFCPLKIREEIYCLLKPVILDGTIRENLNLGKEFDGSQINKALEIVDLNETINVFSNGVDTYLNQSGYPLWPSQLIRLEVARAILHNPKFLVLNEVFDQIGKTRKERILKHFREKNITLLYFSNDSNVSDIFDDYLIIERDKIQKVDSLENLRKMNESN